MLREKRNELVSLQKQLDELKKEKDLLDNIRSDQEAFKHENIHTSAENSRIDELKQKYRVTKDIFRNLTDEKCKLEKEVSQMHSDLIKEKLEIRNLEKLLSEKNRAERKTVNKEDLSQEELQAKLVQFDQIRQQMETENEATIRALERQKKDLGAEVEKMEFLLKDKEHEIRLNSMKLKEMRRNFRNVVLQPVQESKPNKENFRNESQSKANQKKQTAVQKKESSRPKQAKP